MATRQWDPFREIEETWARMGSLLGDVAGGSTWPGTAGPGSAGPVVRSPLAALATFAVPVDIEETDTEFVVDLELPGVRKDDVSVDLRGDEVVVTGQLKERERKGVVRRQTRRLGEFEHRIKLAGDVDPDSVTARLDHGVLTVRLTKVRRDQARHIKISS